MFRHIFWGTLLLFNLPGDPHLHTPIFIFLMFLALQEHFDKKILQ